MGKRNPSFQAILRRGQRNLDSGRQRIHRSLATHARTVPTTAAEPGRPGPESCWQHFACPPPGLPSSVRPETHGKAGPLLDPRTPLRRSVTRVLPHRVRVGGIGSPAAATAAGGGGAVAGAAAGGGTVAGAVDSSGSSSSRRSSRRSRRKRK